MNRLGSYIGLVVLAMVLGCALAEPTPVPPTPLPTATPLPTLTAEEQRAIEAEAEIVEVWDRIMEMAEKIDTLVGKVCPAHDWQVTKMFQDEASVAFGRYQYRLASDPSYENPHKRLEETQDLEGILERTLGELEAFCLPGTG